MQQSVHGRPQVERVSRCSCDAASFLQHLGSYEYEMPTAGDMSIERHHYFYGEGVIILVFQAQRSPEKDFLCCNTDHGSVSGPQSNVDGAEYQTQTYQTCLGHVNGSMLDR